MHARTHPYIHADIQKYTNAHTLATYMQTSINTYIQTSLSLPHVTGGPKNNSSIRV